MIKINLVDKDHPALLNLLNQKNSHGTVLFYSDQCPHCLTMKPQWESMKKKLKRKPVNIYEVNSDDLRYIDHPLKNVIDGFPTILNVNNRNIIPFENERTSENMIKFVESNISKMEEDPAITNEVFEQNNPQLQPPPPKQVRFQDEQALDEELADSLLNALQIGDSRDLEMYLNMRKPTPPKNKTIKKRKSVRKKAIKKKNNKSSKKKKKNTTKNKGKKRKN